MEPILLQMHRPPSVSAADPHTHRSSSTHRRAADRLKPGQGALGTFVLMRLRHLLLAATTGLGLLVLPSGADAARCTISGTDGDDIIVGTDGPDVICAGAGDDTITALGGDDIVYGGAGWDTVEGGDGNDSIYLGPDSGAGYGDGGNDRIVGSRNGGYGLFVGGDGDDVLVGLDSGEFGFHEYDHEGHDAANLFFPGDGDDRIYGSSNDDFIEDYMSQGRKRVWARAGDDTVVIVNGRIEGEGGNDTLQILGYGQAYGGPGDDTVWVVDGVAGGGPGADEVIGQGQLWAGDDADVDHLYVLGDKATHCGVRSNDVFDEQCLRS